MTILRRGSGPVAGDVYLPADPARVLWGRLPCATDEAQVRIESGTTVTIDTLSHEGVLPDQGSDPLAYFGAFGVDPSDVLEEAVELAATPSRRHDTLDGPHVVTGPVGVVGAQPGDLLAITVLETLRRVPYGIISSRHGRGSLAGELPAGEAAAFAFASVAERADGTSVGVLPRRADGYAGGPTVSFGLAPFLGIMGVAVAGSERPHSVPPGAFGGNLDINLLTVGSTLYLPVQVAEALAYVGDPHFAQGDGEVALTAMEASLRATLRFDVVTRSDAIGRFGEVSGPLAETNEFLVPTGLDEDLDLAVANCVRAAIALLEAGYGMDRAHAYAYLSAATDFNISQVVDLVKGAHARIRKSDFL